VPVAHAQLSKGLKPLAGLAFMQTIFDWASVALFIAAAGMFWFRRRRERPHLGGYIVLSIGCAIANQLGDLGHTIIASVLIAALACALVWMATRPDEAGG
jgi:hypothetical protein